MTDHPTPADLLNRAHRAEAEANELRADLDEAITVIYQYRSDLRHPPAPDSVERRLAMIESLLAKINGRALA